MCGSVWLWGLPSLGEEEVRQWRQDGHADTRSRACVWRTVLALVKGNQLQHQPGTLAHLFNTPAPRRRVYCIWLNEDEDVGLADFCRKSLQEGQSPGGDRLLVSTCTLSTRVLGRGRFYHPSESQSLTQRRLFHSYNLKPWGPDMAVFMSTKHIHAEFHWFLTCSCYLKTLGEVCEITTKGVGGEGEEMGKESHSQFIQYIY